MIAVIFKATLRQQLINRQDLDSQKEFDRYLNTAASLRNKALNEYGCTQFTSSTEGDQEIAISYWPNLEAISKWKNDEVHLQAQKIGRERWYEYYKVDVVEILRSYEHITST